MEESSILTNFPGIMAVWAANCPKEKRLVDIDQGCRNNCPHYKGESFTGIIRKIKCEYKSTE